MSSVLLFYLIFLCLYVCHPTALDIHTHMHSSRKQSSWRESVTGSNPQSHSTPRPSPRRSRLTSTPQRRASPRQRMGPSPRRPPASASHPPHRHLPGKAAAAATGPHLQSRRAGESRRSRKNKGPLMRTPIRRTVLSTACLKMSRPKQIKPLQQQRQPHRVRLVDFFYFEGFK